MWVSHPAFAPALSPLAFDGDELVGAIVYLDYPESDEAGSNSSRRRLRTGTVASRGRCCITRSAWRTRPASPRAACRRTRSRARSRSTRRWGCTSGARTRAGRRRSSTGRRSGGRGIRTREAVARLHALQACPFVRSGRPPPSSLSADGALAGSRPARSSGSEGLQHHERDDDRDDRVSVRPS